MRHYNIVIFRNAIILTYVELKMSIIVTEKLSLGGVTQLVLHCIV